MSFFYPRDLKAKEERKGRLAHLELLDPLVPKDLLEMTVQRATLYVCQLPAARPSDGL